MKFLLVALNAKFIHSALGLYSLKGFVKDKNADIIIKEFTINNNLDSITAEIYRTKIKIIGFSFYIWNIENNLQIIDTLKKADPNIFIIAGGPEAYGLNENKNIDIVVLGEGEKPFSEIVDCFLYKKTSLSEIKGILTKENSEYNANDAIQLDEIDFVYQDFSGLENRIIYYETSRGCPFKCQYCMSSLVSGVRNLSLDRVFSDLKIFLDNNIKQVKFVDRTFNCEPERTYKIWEFLIENDNGISNFHFEIAADLINKKQILLLQKARKGLFQFEIGVQSTNIKTLDAITRKTNLDKLFENVRIIKSFGNIHQHLDLIAGLPFEDFDSFKKSFNDVFALRPEQFQLGFLKVLKETGIKEKAKEFEIKYRANAPYEVISTMWLSFEEILDLKSIEDIVELFYNTNRFEKSLNYLLDFFDSPFDFFYSLGIFWESNKLNLLKHNKLFIPKYLFKFAESVKNLNRELLSDLIKYDILLNENLKTLPDIFEDTISESEKNAILRFMKESNHFCFGTTANYRQRLKNYNVKKFNYDILGDRKKQISYIIFRYADSVEAFDITNLMTEFLLEAEA